MPAKPNAALGEAPDHPIITAPWSYRIEALHFVGPTETGQEPHLDLNLRRGDRVRRLRFFDPTEIAVAPNFCQAAIGLEILDVSDRGWEGVGVRVDSFEGGGLQFWARAVADLDVLPPD